MQSKIKSNYVRLRCKNWCLNNQLWCSRRKKSFNKCRKLYLSTQTVSTSPSLMSCKIRSSSTNRKSNHASTQCSVTSSASFKRNNSKETSLLRRNCPIHRMRRERGADMLARLCARKLKVGLLSKFQPYLLVSSFWSPTSSSCASLSRASCKT